MMEVKSSFCEKIKTIFYHLNIFRSVDFCAKGFRNISKNKNRNSKCGSYRLFIVQYSIMLSASNLYSFLCAFPFTYVKWLRITLNLHLFSVFSFQFRFLCHFHSKESIILLQPFIQYWGGINITTSKLFALMENGKWKIMYDKKALKVVL